MHSIRCRIKNQRNLGEVVENHNKGSQKLPEKLRKIKLCSGWRMKREEEEETNEGEEEEMNGESKIKKRVQRLRLRLTLFSGSTIHFK